jgi:ubiquitin-activating enzyme E1
MVAKDQLEEIKSTIDLYNHATSFEKCVHVARDLFDQLFDHIIRDLKSNFPDDHKDQCGNPFWSGLRRCPHPIYFNVHDELHMSFIMACANLIAFNLGVPQ